jgi:hypothetical protein
MYPRYDVAMPRINSPKRERIDARVPATTAERLRALAQLDGTTLSDVVVAALVRYVTSRRGDLPAPPPTPSTCAAGEEGESRPHSP